MLCIKGDAQRRPMQAVANSAALVGDAFLQPVERIADLSLATLDVRVYLYGVDFHVFGGSDAEVLEDPRTTYEN